MNPECSICLSKISNENLCITNCNHKYCYRCLNKWIEKNKATCPYCRTTIQFYKHNKQMTRIICIDNTIEPFIEPQRNRNINLITVDRRIYSFLKFGTIVSGLLASINIYFLIK